MEKIKKLLPQIVAIGAAVLAFIFALFLAGLKNSEEGVTGSVTLIGLIFGGGTIKASGMGVETSMDFDGGMSIFGLISFILLVVGIISLVISIFKEGKFDVIGYILIALAGICIFLLKVAGTDVSMSLMGMSHSESFKNAFEEFNLGAGVFVYGILAILGGLFGLVKKFFLK